MCSLSVENKVHEHQAVCNLDVLCAFGTWWQTRWWLKIISRKEVQNWNIKTHPAVCRTFQLKNICF